MSKLYFRYGAMGASKTANALMVEYNYRERGQKALLFKPAIDNRDGVMMVKSRVGLSKEALLIESTTDLEAVVTECFSLEKIDCIIIDEAQFLTKAQVKQLCNIVDNMEIPVIAYGLRTDFMGNLFEGSTWLLAWADTIEEIKTVCFCSRKAIMNARVLDSEVIKHGQQIQIGGNESYIALCRKHWEMGVTK